MLYDINTDNLSEGETVNVEDFIYITQKKLNVGKTRRNMLFHTRSAGKKILPSVYILLFSSCLSV